MKTTQPRSLRQIAGWCAYVSAGALVIGMVTLVTFFIVGDPFGIMNDIASVVIALSSIPVLLALHQLHRPVNPLLSWMALVLGVFSLLVAALTQSMLVLKIIPYEQTAPATIGFGLFGVALMVYGMVAYTSQIFPRKLSVWGTLAGLGYALVTVGFLLGQQDHLFSYIGGLMTVIAFPTWAIMLGRTFLKVQE